MRGKMSWSMLSAAISLLIYLGVAMPQGAAHAASGKAKWRSTPIRHEINLGGVNDTGMWNWLRDGEKRGKGAISGLGPFFSIEINKQK